MLPERQLSRGEKRPHISICICTFKRPQLLMRLLQSVRKQTTDGLFDFSIVVVDNDKTGSAEAVVRCFAESCEIATSYDCEPEQNISLARNRAIDKAQGDFVAFVDDDEFPEDDWLLNVYRACEQFGADGVLAPVRPHFRTPPPKWIVKGRFFYRPSFPTGTVIGDCRHTRTGNVLLRKSVFAGDGAPFDPRFGRTGGGDREFFKRKIAAGGVFVWCDEAIVYETVPADRCKRAFLLRSAFVRGVSAAMLGRLGLFNVCKSLIAVALYTSALPMLLVTGHHRFMKVLIKDCDHISKLLAACGWVLVKERTEVRSEGA
jgi:glycosyltransferase involved in cell wall biosynthesis